MYSVYICITKSCGNKFNAAHAGESVFRVLERVETRTKQIKAACNSDMSNIHVRLSPIAVMQHAR